jgi:hypothetical protein
LTRSDLYWGAQRELDRFLQAYAVEKTRLEARRQGHSVSEQALADGSISLTVTVNGGTSTGRQQAGVSNRSP